MITQEVSRTVEVYSFLLHRFLVVQMHYSYCCYGIFIFMNDLFVVIDSVDIKFVG
jgi:hypothetical protein